jgi:PAS domain S-box-containing protein
MNTVFGTSPAVAAWKALIEGLLEAVWLVDAASLQVVAANTAAGQLFRTPARAFVGRHVTELSATPEDLAFWDEVVAGTCDGLWSDTWARRFDGDLVPVTRRVTRVRVPDGPDQPNQPQGLGDLFVVALNDRSAQRDAESALETRVAELRATLESTADGILVTDLNGAIRGFNRHFAMLWGMPDDLLSQGNDPAVHAWMRRSVTDPDVYARRLEAIQASRLLHGTDTLTLRGGRVLERVTLPQVIRGEAVGRVYSFRDITERLASRQRIEELSYTDPLTGLPNRHLLADRVEFALAMAQREQQPFALIVLNLDRFKHINETLGLGVGDRVLREASERVKACLRTVDTVARLGGD